MTKQYTDKDIKVLSDRDHVRVRLGIYFGSNTPTDIEVLSFADGIQFKQYTIVPATFKAVGEILDNSIDEFAQISTKKKVLTIAAQPDIGTYVIGDNGRGVPISKHETGRFTPELVFSSLRSGRNFTNNRKAGVQGQNGIGSSGVCFSSSKFEIAIHREGKKYEQSFMNGGLDISKPKITKGPIRKTGTQIAFTLDPEVYSSIALPKELMQQRAMELAALNPGLIVNYNDIEYKFKHGLEELIAGTTKPYFKFSSTIDGTTLEFFLVFGLHNNIDEKIFTYVNSSPLFEGGICNTQFLNVFYSKVIEQLQTTAKKNKIDVTRNDVRHGLTIIGNLKIPNAEYDAQSKTRLVNPTLRKEIDILLSDQWAGFIRKNKGWLADIIERARLRYNQNTNKRAVKEMRSQSTKKIPGLIDANSLKRSECCLLITEGKSAASSITDVRNPRTTGCYPLTGKINNVYNMDVAQILKAGKITDLLLAIGLVPGQTVQREQLRYGKIIIATDADVDGDDIFTLLVNLFYQFWPELFSAELRTPMVYRLITPNVIAINGNERIHFPTAEAYTEVKYEYEKHEINYLKGLGSMEREDFKQVLSSEEYLIPIIDDGKLKKTLELLFSPEVAARKDWLT